jgi:hypothetical protein
MSFSQLEETIAVVRKLLTEEMFHGALERQAAQVERPPEYSVCPGCGLPTQAADSPEDRRLEAGNGDAIWSEPKTHYQKCRWDFFPSDKSKSLGIDRSSYCPSLQRKIVYAGAAHQGVSRVPRRSRVRADTG